MKTKVIKYSISMLFSACFLMSGCVGLDVAPADKFTDENYWTSETKAASVLHMAYRQLMDEPMDFLKLEILSDNVYQGYGTSDEKIIVTGQANASTGRFSSEWDQCYGGIKTCHTFLRNVDRVPNMDASLKERMKLEIRFIRAYQFFRLTNWFGDIPHFSDDITLEESKSLPRKSQSLVMEWIHEELEEIAERLPNRQQYSSSDRGRITSGAAIALNARAYLYEGNWAKVKEMCEKLVLSTDYGKYALFPSYEQLFWVSNEYNDEIILDIQYVPTVRTWNSLASFVPMSAEAALCLAAPTQGLVDSYLMANGEQWTENDPAYANRDPRMSATIVYDGSRWTDRDGREYEIVIHPEGNTPDGKRSDKYVGQGTTQTSTGYYYRKYADPSPSAYTTGWESNLNIPVIRFADVLLMYAEAVNELGQMNEEIWNMTIRKLRERAGFENTAKAINLPDGSQEELREIIRNERRCELALEGLRVFDIRRWGIAETVLRQNPRGAKLDNSSGTYDYIKLPAGNFSRDRDYLWAIPRKERNLNSNLTQNPGY